MKKFWIGIPVLILLAIAAIGPIMSRVEQPNYTVIDSPARKIQVRQYDPMIIAEVRVSGERSQAINQGFRMLADFIFGNNSMAEEVSMTAPVMQQPSSTKIAMTAPVSQTPYGSNSWVVSFVMPSKFTLETLPRPTNDSIKLKKLPVQYYACIKFSGSSNSENIQENLEKILAFLSNNDAEPIGPPTYAFYNPPWTLPFLRRNEILIPIDKNTVAKLSE